MVFFVLVFLLGFSYWILKKLGFSSGENTGLSNKVKDSFDDIYDDNELVKDLANILKQEGDLDKLFDKIYKNGIPEWDDVQWIKSYKFQPDAKRIANKLVKTMSYKKFSKTHNFDKKDDQGMEKIFYFIITQKDFKDVAKIFIMKAIDKNDDLINKGENPKALRISDLMPAFGW
jgi:hypothetical protein